MGISTGLGLNAIKSVAENLNNLHVAIHLLRFAQERGVIAEDVDVDALAMSFAFEGESLEAETRAAFEAIEGAWQKWPDSRRNFDPFTDLAEFIEHT